MPSNSEPAITSNVDREYRLIPNRISDLPSCEIDEINYQLRLKFEGVDFMLFQSDGMTFYYFGMANLTPRLSKSIDMQTSDLMS